MPPYVAPVGLTEESGVPKRDGSSTPSPSISPATTATQLPWAEFTSSEDGPRINNQTSVSLVVPNYSANGNVITHEPSAVALLEELKSEVAEALQALRLQSSVSGAVNHTSAVGLEATPPPSPAVTIDSWHNWFIFSEPHNIRIVERCLAIHHRAPCLVFSRRQEDMGGIRMADEEDEESNYVLSFSWPYDVITQHHPQADAKAARLAAIEGFFQRVLAGTEPVALGGPAAALYHHFPFEPFHGVVLCEGRSAVTGTLPQFLPLLPGAPCAIGIIWSDSCVCCPAALMLMEQLVSLVKGLLEGMTAVPPATAVVPFHYFASNVRQNDLPPAVFPRPEGTHTTVPAILSYQPPSCLPTDAEMAANATSQVSFLFSRMRVQHFKEEMTVKNVLDFLLDGVIRCGEQRAILQQLCREVLCTNNYTFDMLSKLVPSHNEAESPTIREAWRQARALLGEPETCEKEALLWHNFHTIRKDLLSLREMGVQSGRRWRERQTLEQKAKADAAASGVDTQCLDGSLEVCCRIRLERKRPAE